jgi:hypothetical protein
MRRIKITLFNTSNNNNNIDCKCVINLHVDLALNNVYNLFREIDQKLKI